MYTFTGPHNNLILFDFPKIYSNKKWDEMERIVQILDSKKHILIFTYYWPSA